MHSSARKYSSFLGTIKGPNKIRPVIVCRFQWILLFKDYSMIGGKQQHKNPTPTVDTIIQKGTKVLLVERKKDPFKQMMVLPGGFINEGERAEDAAIREVKEETSLDIVLDNILGVYSDPSRDPRGHIMSTVFIGKISNKSDKKEPIAGDDAATTKWVDLASIEEEQFGFDHKKILMDYKEWKQSGQTYWSSKKLDQY